MDEHYQKLEDRIFNLEERIELLEQELLIRRSGNVFAQAKVVSNEAKKLEEIIEDEQPAFWKQSDFWLNKVGVVLLLISVAYFFSYSVEQGWINAWARIVAGVFAGTALYVGSFWVKENDVHMEELLKGAGFGVFYLTIFAAFSWYNLIGQSVAASLTIVVTILAFSTALAQNKELIAYFAVLGGYISPFLLSSDDPSFTGYLSFVSIVTISAALMSLYKVWRSLGVLAITIGWTLSLVGFIGIFEPEMYGAIEKALILVFFILMLVATGPLHYLRYEPTKDWFEWDLVLLVNTPVLFLIAQEIMGISNVWLGVFSWLVGGGFLGLVWLLKDKKMNPTVFTASGVLLLAFGSYFVFETQFWVVFTVMSGILSAYISRNKSELYVLLDYLMIAGGLLITLEYLGSTYAPTRIFFNVEALLFLAMMGSLLWYIPTIEHELGKKGLILLAHIVFMVWIYAECASLSLATVVITVLWVIYVITLMIYSVRKGDSFLRLISILSLMFILAKLFLVDMNGLDMFWRFVLLASVGGFLMTVSYLYKRMTSSK